jgi:glycosyltransferase involved in cell wall biosynthesis
MNKTYPNINELNAESEEQYEYRLKNNLKYDSTRNHTIWFPFVSNFLEVTQTNPNSDVIKVFTVGKIQPRKNLHKVITFLSDYALKNEVLIELIVAGEYSETQKMYLSYLNNLKDLAPQNLDIKIVTNVNSKNIKNIFRISDIFLLLSENEVASVAQVEAFISGCKVLVFHENGNLDFLPINPMYQKIYVWSEFEYKFDKILKLNESESQVLRYIEVYNKLCGGSNAVHRLLKVFND